MRTIGDAGKACYRKCVSRRPRAREWLHFTPGPVRIPAKIHEP
jgi:hypothetical protein